MDGWAEFNAPARIGVLAGPVVCALHMSLPLYTAASTNVTLPLVPS
jgi:hypothetical protein